MEFIKQAAHFIAYIVEGAAILTILIGTIQALFFYLRNLLPKQTKLTVFMQSRFKLGMSLSLGLGFLVGADVIKTAIAPTWNDIGQLSAIVVIRIVLNFFLMRDLDNLEKIELR